MIKQLKCSFTGKSELKKYYASLSKTTLEAKKKELPIMLIAPAIAWLTTFLFFLLFADMDVAMTIMLFVPISGTVILLIDDYTLRKRLIEEELEKF